MFEALPERLQPQKNTFIESSVRCFIKFGVEFLSFKPRRNKRNAHSRMEFKLFVYEKGKKWNADEIESPGLSPCTTYY
jgi:hypothetical protein